MPLQRAWATAPELEARPLLAEVESLSRRARITLAPEPAATAEGQSAAAQPAAPGHELGLTPREREVLALVAEGRTNRQAADPWRAGVEATKVCWPAVAESSWQSARPGTTGITGVCESDDEDTGTGRPIPESDGP